MYRFERKFFDSEDSCLNFLVNMESINDSNVGIVTGHYMLIYAPDSDTLIPAVYEDVPQSLKMYVWALAYDFPTHSLRISLELYKKLFHMRLNPKLILVVNDHKFQSNYFPPFTYDQISDRAGLMRQEYYRRSQPIPESFLSLICKNNLSATEVFLSNHSKKRKDESVLPEKSMLFSEHVLRKKFDKFTRPKLLRNQMFCHGNTLANASHLLFIPPNQSATYCLTEEDYSKESDGKNDTAMGTSCGCSGEVIQFLKELTAKNFFDIVFFVPSDCAKQVDVGIQAALYAFGPDYEKHWRVVTISNIENDDIENEGRGCDTIQVGVHAYYSKR